MLEETKKIILDALKNNTRNTHDLAVYAFTNENLKDCLKETKGKDALSICSSGDQYLNLVGSNFKNIDLIDINPLTEYYTLGIKQALILAFNYEDFQKIITILFKKSKNLEIEKKILQYLLNFMPLKYQIFWQEIFAYYLNLQEIYQREISLFQILTQDYYFDLEEIKFFNNYLQGQEEYEQVKQNLSTIHYSFTLNNILTLETKKAYDLIICSNILEYTYHPNLDLKKLRDLYRHLRQLLKEEGMIEATYIYSLYTKGELRSFPIGGTNITGRELIKEELKLIPNYRDQDQNAVLILRK